MLRPMVVRVRVALCVPLLLLGGCRDGTNDTVYPPEPATARQLSSVDASPAQVLPSATGRTSCVGPWLVKAEVNPLLLCLRVGESATVMLPEVPGEWLPAKTSSGGVVTVRRQKKTDNGGAHFDVFAERVGTATVTIQNPGTGEAPGRVAQVTVNVRE
jgi:hypothetical protein